MSKACRREVRNAQKGDILFKDYATGPIAAVVAEDYRMDGTPCIMTVTNDGSVPQRDNTNFQQHRAWNFAAVH